MSYKRLRQDRMSAICRAKTGLMLALLSGTTLAILPGCEVDSYLDPSVMGRWEQTPTTVPILDRLNSIEDPEIPIVEKSRIQPADLIPEATEYEFAVGDQMEIRIRDYFQIGQEDLFQVTVDQIGYVDVPKLPAILAQGLTKPELQASVEQAIRDAQINAHPVLSINLLSQRKSTFSVLGAAQQPGTYFIPASDYRLLEGITAASGIDENVKSIYVIRQVPLTEAAAAGQKRKKSQEEKPTPSWTPTTPTQTTPPPPAPEQGEKLIDLIDELSGSKKPEEIHPKSSPTESAPSPGMLRRQDPEKPTTPAKPPIDLPGLGARPTERVPQNMEQGVGGYVFRDGKWMKKGEMPRPEGAPMLTQRVIEIPVEQLLAGVADVNIVLRPGDIVRVPPNKSGLVYIAGQVNRPGPYNLPNDGGKLTLQRALTSAGGLSSTAIPERVDLTRIVGPNRQATIRVNCRAIAEGTQPDIYLKADDQINVGTNFYALPLAVIRNGFRASYGFGFILDRNFGNDVFGAPPAESIR